MFTNKCFPQYLMNTGPCIGFLCQHLLHQLNQILAVMGWDGRDFPLDDFIHESIDVSGRKGMFQGGYFMHTTPQSPDVGLVVIRLVCKKLRAHVVRCTNDSVGQITGTIQHACYTQVTYLCIVKTPTKIMHLSHLDDIIFTKKYILCLRKMECN